MTNAYSQTFLVDSVASLLLEPIGRSIKTVPKNQVILEIESHYFELNDISSCLMLLEMYQLDSINREQVFIRLENFADYFFQINEPLIIVDNGKNSFERARTLNQENQIRHLRYISLGNSCLGDTNEEIGINRFNKKTWSLIRKIE